MTSLRHNTDLQSRSVLTIDIVGFSAKQTWQMFELLRVLYSLIEDSIPEGRNLSSYRIWSPAGDGGSLTFVNSSDALHTAIKLLHLIGVRNSEIEDRENPLLVRMGIHEGPIIQGADYDGERQNIWGHGINGSTRICNLAGPNQILASQRYCQSIDLVSHDGNSIQSVEFEHVQAEYYGRWWVKHNQSFEVYNINIKNLEYDQPNQIHPWFTPFDAPVAGAVKIYQDMLKRYLELDYADKQQVFRSIVVAKRLIDLEPNREKIVEILSNINDIRGNSDHLFNRFHNFSLRYFVKHSRFIQYSAKKWICETNHVARSMYFIVHGEVGVYIDQNKTNTFKENEIIGEMAYFRSQDPKQRFRTASLKAELDTLVLEFDYKNLDILYNQRMPQSEINYQAAEDIRRVLYKYIYIERRIMNSLQTHPTFSYLSLTSLELIQRRLDLDIDLLPKESNEPIIPTSLDVWDNDKILIVIEGYIKAEHIHQGFDVYYEKHRIMGLNSFKHKKPYGSLTVSPDAEILIMRNSVLLQIETVDHKVALLLQDEQKIEEEKWIGSLQKRK